MVVPIMALTKNTPVFVNIETIEDCIMQVITLEDLKKIEEQEPVLVKDMLIDVHNNVLQHFYNYQLLNSYDTKTRIKELFKMYPPLKDVKNEYVASLLGKDPLHLFKIRKELRI